MPAKSKSQQRLFGMVHAYQKGKLKDAPESVKEIARSISDEDAEHFAKTKHKGLPEKKAYELGFMDKLAEYGMAKEAKNVLRLLSRVGPDLAGATERDLKFLARRGFKGFTPQQVQALRAKGLLPSIDQELAGFNKGTENMLKFTTSGTTHPDYASSFDLSRPPEIKRLRRKAYDSGADIFLRRVKIPDVSMGKSVGTRERLASIARHEAREWVRGNAAVAKGRKIELPGLQSVFGVPLTEAEVGTSHMPGVIHDERVFRSQLSNRLGLGKRWDELPILKTKGVTLYRAPRDAYVGSKPLPYEFDVINSWYKGNENSRQRINRAFDFLDTKDAERIYIDAYRKIPRTYTDKDLLRIEKANRIIRRAHESLKNQRLSENSMLRASKKARRALSDLGVFNDPAAMRRRIIMDHIIYPTQGVPGAFEEPPLGKLKPHVNYLRNILAEKAGVPFDKFRDTLMGHTLGVPAAPDSELHKVMQLSVEPRVQGKI